MVEVARFFDTILYGESDQAEVQSRFRPTGVLYEVGSRLAVSAPGGMFVSVADGEAMAEGFHYKNTTAKQIAIASNTSGATRFDRIVLRLDRVANSLSAVVKQGTPGSGAYPALTQIAGGVWEIPLAGLGITSGALSIVAGNLSDHRPFGSMLHNSIEVGLAAAQGTFAGVQRRILTTDASGGLYFDENAPGRHNFLHNTGFQINQRGATSAVNDGEYASDRWRFGFTANVGFAVAVAPITSSLAPQGSEGGNAIYLTRNGATTVPASNTIISFSQILEGIEVVHLSGMPMMLSFWTLATKTGVYGVNVEQIGTNWKYISTFTVNAANVWEYKTIQVPWTTNGTWQIGSAAGAIGVRFIAAAGSAQQTATSNAWVNDARWAAPTVGNPLSALNDTLYIVAPKLEVGTLATRWEPQDYGAEIIKAYRYLYVEQPSGMQAMVVHGVNNFVGTVALPVHMRVAPTFLVTPTPTYNNAGSPTGAQFSMLCAGGFVTGVTYSTWVSWLPSNRFFGSLFTSSTNAPGVASGQAGIFTLGNGLKLVYSAEL